MKDQSVDGLRGLAALSVVASHFLLAIYPTALSGYFPWVVAPTALHGRIDALLSLPVLSSLWNGNVAVLIFFVLSGYVLTLPFTRGGIPDEIRGRMLRRLPRLAVPIFGSVVFAYAVMLVTHRLPAVVSPLTGSVWLSIHWNLAPSFPTALQDAVYGALLRGSTYNSALWTMRIEFIGSMLIFAYCLLEAPERRNLCAFLFGGVLFAYFPSEWPMYGCFLAGYLMTRWHGPRSRVCAGACLLIGLTLASAHDGSPLSPSRYLSFLGDQNAVFVRAIGAVFIFYSIRGGHFDRVLKASAVQLLGRISYSLYLVHMPIILSLTCWTYLKVLPFGFPKAAAAAVALVVTLPVLLIVSLIFERLFDRTGIRLSKILSPNKSVSGVQPSC